MKRYIKSDYTMSTTKLIELRKLVNRLVYTKYFRNDFNKDIIKDFIASDELDYPKFVYDHRHEYFDEYVIDMIETLNNDLRGVRIQDADREFMLEYYNQLTPADYSRNLYLRRDAPSKRRRS